MPLVGKVLCGLHAVAAGVLEVDHSVRWSALRITYSSPRKSTVRVFEKLSDLTPLVGQEVAVSDWELITQQRIDLFAEATGDHQWIHVDPERSAKGPFGTTIAHGHLTLSMLPLFFQTAMQIKDLKMGVNYGLNRVRFTSPVPVGSELRAHMKLMSVEDLADGGAQLTWQVTVERKGSDRPVCVAESIGRRYA